MAKQQTATIQLPIISNPYGIPCFEDFIAEAQRRYDVEKDLKNAAFAFLTSKGLYNEYHKYLHNPDTNKCDDIIARLENTIDYSEQEQEEPQAVSA